MSKLITHKFVKADFVILRNEYQNYVFIKNQNFRFNVNKLLFQKDLLDFTIYLSYKEIVSQNQKKGVIVP